LSFLRE